MESLLPVSTMRLFPRNIKTFLPSLHHHPALNIQVTCFMYGQFSPLLRFLRGGWFFSGKKKKTLFILTYLINIVFYWCQVQSPTVFHLWWRFAENLIYTLSPCIILVPSSKLKDPGTINCVWVCVCDVLEGSVTVLESKSRIVNERLCDPSGLARGWQGTI